jgi:predicted nucleotidyltransferase
MVDRAQIRKFSRAVAQKFRPRKIILFGSYAYGNPDEASDVDLLVVKDLAESVLRDKVHIRRAWWKMPRC